MIDSWKAVAVTLIVGLVITAITFAIVISVYESADHRRQLMRECLNGPGPARTPADCHNGIYGSYR